MSTWIKQDDSEIELNDESATMEAAIENGWEPKKAKAVKKQKEPEEAEE